MSEIILIRHGETAGNSKKRYIGATDEPLLDTSIEALRSGEYPRADILFVSPLKRCMQTAEAIYPGMAKTVVPDLRECDFGLFENKNYLELSDSPEYSDWIAADGKAPFPGGEDPIEFKERCIRAFAAAVRSCIDAQTPAFVVHGGTIMAIMEHFAHPHREFYEWYVKNGGGYKVSSDASMSLTVLSSF